MIVSCSCRGFLTFHVIPFFKWSKQPNTSVFFFLVNIHVCDIVALLTSLTLIFDLAEVSKKAQLFHWRARFWPCSLPTTRSSSRSHLFPTRIMGTWLTEMSKLRHWLLRTAFSTLCFHHLVLFYDLTFSTAKCAQSDTLTKRPSKQPAMNK